MASPNASSPSTPPPPTPAQQQQPPQNQNPYIHNVALGVTPLALLALFLPPRRLDARTLILGGTALWGTNQLVYDYSGTSTFQRLQHQVGSFAGTELPEKARETQIKLRAERERRRLLQEGITNDGLTVEQRRMIEEQRKKREDGGTGKNKEDRGLLEKVWMGDSGDDWKEKREQREKEALSEGGGGYWGLIVDQISEVWSGKKKDDGEGKEKYKDKTSEQKKS
ncbi:uncharacterized protein F4822DRAFT_395000 [Hypoxylon trugodes]|uniref:uncharacterized protein n=1 Tax=Hypoxylon trugodes TaxID=326681 RepID=UPI00218E0718|nr:uncharacterized protein F4822DRAFT_395000 [Hypoxylon trugodes]KAI1390967.1 hypothetical protein F4822DRAFT_395000 [Hypoxylon trugodes]